MIKSFRHLILIVSIISLPLSFIKAQPIILVDTLVPKVHFTHFDSDNGLLQNIIKYMAFDDEDFLWFTYEKGLTRFDGSSFKHYTNKDYEALLRNERFIRLVNLNDFLSVNDTSSITISNGKLQFGSEPKIPKDITLGFKGQLLNLDKYPYLEDEHFQNIRKDNFYSPYRIFFHINKKSLYGANQKGGLDFFKNGQKVSETPMEYTYDFQFNKQWLSNSRREKLYDYYSRYFTLGNSLFFLTPNNRLREYQNGKLIQEYQFDKDLGETKVLWQEGHPIVICSGTLMYQLQKEDGKYKLQILLNLPEGNPNCIVNYDESGLFFIGTQLNGLYKAEVQSFISNFSEKGGPKNNDRSITEIGKDSILTSKGLLCTPQYTKDQTDNISHLSIPNTAFLYEFKKFVGRKDPVGSTFEKHAVPSWWLGNYLKDRYDSIWYAGRDGIISIIDEQCKIIYSDTVQGDQLYKHSFYNPFKHSIWRTFKDRTEIYSIKDGVSNRKEILNGLDIKNVYFENPNRTWFNLIGKGIALLTDSSFTLFPPDNKEALNASHAIIEDDYGYFWVSTDRGLIKVSKQELLHFKEKKTSSIHYHHFNKQSGFLTNEFNGNGSPCGLKLSNGKIAFPSLKGVVSFDPKNIQILSAGSAISIGKVKIDGKDTLIDLKQGLDQNFEQLEFSILYSYYGNPDNLQIEYKVKGLHQQWYKVPESNIIRLPAISYGEYELLVRRKNGFSVNDFTYLNYPFSINPTFYQTSLFKISLSLFILILLLAAFWFSSWVAKQNRLRLEKIIQEKTHDQLVLNEELKLNLAKLRESDEEQKISNDTKDRFMAIYTHDVRGPLRFIQTITKSSLKRLDKIDEDELRIRLEDIEQSTYRIYSLTERMFHWLRSQKEEVHLKEETFHLSPFTREAISLFKEQASLKNISLNLNSSSSVEIKSEKNVLSIILSNIIDNAIKYTVKGSITTTIHQLKDNVVISITDTGIGISPQKLKEINSGVYSSTEGTNGEQGTGFGLKTIKELILMIGGYMEINSEESKGCSVSVFLPLEPSL